ncbi:14526_t:CDS:2 [Cetraspora pellucida]|uniref:14526_t:CDS:1 n=1 Tax=Cetraspora pellucida TaxID=1433469 RepID=A0A9N9B9N4_9GLOM|nr:14526_t:CDS:2 [Cetraspora pellucida]
MDDYDLNNYDLNDYDQDNYDQDNYDQDNYDQDNYDQDNYDHNNYNQNNNDENNHNQDVTNEISSEYSVSTSEVLESSIINPVNLQKNKSSVCAYFSLLTNKQKAICNYCKYQLSHKKSTGMSHLHRHLKSCRKYQKSVFKKGSAELPKGQMQLEFSPTIKLSNDSIRKNLVDMIIRDELSFHADIVKRDIIKAYDIRKVYIKEILQSAKGKISLTCDIWMLLQQLEYLSITAHFLDKNWNLIFILLSFRLIPFSHSGVNIANCIKVVTDVYLITNKVMKE